MRAFRSALLVSILLGPTACGPGRVVEIDAGKDYVCARFKRGQTACHNYDNAGGPENWEDSVEWPNLETPDVKLESFMTQYVHLCGLDRDGNVHCTGRTDFYEPIPAGQFEEVATGNYSTCALDAAGEATCWGLSFYDPDLEYYKGSDLEPLPGPYQNILPHDNGWCGHRTDGTVTCWGHNSRGPASPPEGVAFERVFPNRSQVYCGKTVGGDTQCWGWEEKAPEFQSILSTLSPYEVAELGLDAACVLRADGEVRCESLPYADPAEYLPPSDIRFEKITAGYRFFCGLTDDAVDGHRVICWGCRWDDEDADPSRPGQCVQPPW